MPGALDWLDPEVEQSVLSADGEQIRDEVRRHWMASAAPALRIGAALVAFSTAWLLGGLWLLVLIALAVGLVVQALWRLASHYRDRFVVTDRRIFRVYGNLTQIRTSLPMTGISAIELRQPFLGKVFGYGHLRFVAAANDHGLTEVRWVPEVEARAALIRTLMAEHLVASRGT